MEKNLTAVIKTDRSTLYMGKVEWIEPYRSAIENLELQTEPEIIVFGKVCHQRRNIQFYSDASSGYSYSNQKAKAKPLTPELREILEKVNDEFDDEYNGILVNRYDDGTKYIGSHSDDERELGNSGVVAIIIGATRKFRIRDAKTRKIVKDVEVPDKHLVCMAGGFQKEFKHEIPQQKTIKDSRISLTFRKHTN